MLPSSQRLSRQQISEFLINKGVKTVFNQLGTLKYLPSTTKAFTVITGSKNQKSAVLRNRLRRQLYTMFSRSEKTPILGMLYVSKQVYSMSYSDLKQYLYDLLEKISSKTQKNT